MMTTESFTRPTVSAFCGVDGLLKPSLKLRTRHQSVATTGKILMETILTWPLVTEFGKSFMDAVAVGDSCQVSSCRILRSN